jgi:hypothetical protein
MPPWITTTLGFVREALDVSCQRAQYRDQLLAVGASAQEPVWADRVSGQRQPHAGGLDDVGVDVSQDLAQRLVRVGTAGRRGGTGDIDPCTGFR